MYRSFGCLPSDIWSVIFLYVDIPTIRKFPFVHPNFVKLAKDAFLEKQKRRLNYKAIEVILIHIQLREIEWFFLVSSMHSVRQDRNS